jgi:hypothetical protein
MTSSTRRFDGSGGTAVVIVLALVLVALAHLTFNATATFAEERLGAYLWKEQDYLRLFSPAYHDGRGAGRLLIYGPSEAREGLLPEEIAVAGLSAYQNAQSFGTLADGLLVLDYLESAYGRDAVPDALLFAISSRFVADIRPPTSPLVEGMKKYSPHFRPDDSANPPRLVRKSATEALRARLAILSLEPDRYRRGVAAVVASITQSVAPALSAYPARLARPSKYLTGKLAPEADLQAWTADPASLWHRIHKWDPAVHQPTATAELHRLVDFAAARGVELYVVNLPEISWMRTRYLPGRYEAYLATVRAGIGDTPFLDLRSFLDDDEFFDEAHPTWQGARRLSAEVSRFIARARPARVAEPPE